VAGDSEARDLASASYQRCCDRPGFFESFYRNFLTVCPEAAPRFARTDFARQNKLLRHAIGVLLIFPKQPDAEPTLLTRIAERHSRRDLAVPASLYPPFVDSLIATVKQYDPICTPEIEEAWRRTVAKGVQYMVSRY
jgi:hemoglobin-like flavoprotein